MRRFMYVTTAMMFLLLPACGGGGGGGGSGEQTCIDYYADMDGDGYGDPNVVQNACTVPENYVTDNTDCDDSQPSINPGAMETVDNGRDDDCDGSDLCYLDADDDGYRPDAVSTVVDNGNLTCTDSGEAQASDPTTDCDDTLFSVNPGATEAVDNSRDDDCDGFDLCYQDADDDGYRPDAVSTVADNGNLTCTDSGEAQASDPTTDCDDTDATMSPDTVWYEDGDGDGYSSGGTMTQCTQPTGFALASTLTATSGDCDDTLFAVNPGAAETVDNGRDDDCNGFDLCYLDADGDGYRPDALSTMADNGNLTCTDGSEAQASDPTNDCDDTLFSVNPGATEAVDNGRDEDCDGFDLCYQDADDDGYRPDATSTVQDSGNLTCTDSGEAQASDPTTDCDDTNAAMSPDTVWYEDGDSDGYSSGVTMAQCTQPAGFALASTLTATSGDCDDTLSTVNPGATETVDNGRDDDCDGSHLCYLDADNDGYRPDTTSTVQDSGNLTCTDSGEAQASDPTNDCDDTRFAVNPGVTEAVDNGRDDDCDGFDLCYQDADDDGYRPDSASTVADSGNLTCTDSGEAQAYDPTTDCDDTNAEVNPNTVWYEDSDSDGYSSGTIMAQCPQPAGFALASTLTATSGDCDDTLSTVHPGVTETVDNGIDDDCDGSDLCYLDADGDGYRPDAVSTVVDNGNFTCTDGSEAQASDPTTDCDDTLFAVNPGATEAVDNGRDEDCDGFDLCYQDADDDGYRPDSASTVADSGNLTCTDSGEAQASDPTTDCDDTNAEVNPDTVWYEDGDDDGYSSGVTMAQCTQPAGFALASTLTATSGDCDDTLSTVNPGATETVDNGRDDDCDGFDLCYLDADDDGYRPDAVSTVSDSGNLTCTDSGEAQASDPTADCDDTSAEVNPGTVWYEDNDDDGYSNGVMMTQCTQPTGFALASALFGLSGDCNDGDPSINPGEPEICDGVDNDCVGGIDDGACYQILPPLPYPTAVDTYDSVVRDDSATDASVITLKEVQERTLFPAGDQDWVSVDLQAGNEYEFVVTYLSVNTDTKLFLYDVDGTTLLLQNDDYIGTGSRVIFTPAVDGVYFLNIQPFSLDPAGVASYRLFASPFVDTDVDGHSALFDCDDEDAGRYPYATEIAADGIDQNCSGEDAIVPTTPDASEDGDDLPGGALPMVLVDGQGTDYIFRTELFPEAMGTIDSAADVDWLQVTMPPFSAGEPVRLLLDGEATNVSLQCSDDNGASTFSCLGFVENSSASPLDLLVRLSNASSTNYVVYFSSFGNDLDGDFYYDMDWARYRDCDDSDAAVNPGGTDDSVDGTDQDCDGVDGI